MTGNHMTETRIIATAKTIHQCGHSFKSVAPLRGSHAGYLLPFADSSTNDAKRIVIMAIGEIYFQHSIQYRDGRDPVISSMSSAKLKEDLPKIRTKFCMKNYNSNTV